MPPQFDVRLPWAAHAAGPGGKALVRLVLPEWLPRQRWFSGHARQVTGIDVEEAVRLPVGDAVLMVVRTDFADGGHQRFAVPVGYVPAAPATRLRHEAPERILANTTDGGVLHDDMTEGLGLSLLLAIARSERWPTACGELVGERTSGFDALIGHTGIEHVGARRITGEQSNTSVILGDRVILKLVRRLEPGLNPDYDIGRHLTDRVRFEGVPALAGAVVWRGHGAEPTVVSIAQAFVEGASGLREHVVRALAAFMREEVSRVDNPGWSPAAGACHELLESAAALGRRTGELHRALADAHGDPDFEPAPATAADLAAASRDMQAQVEHSLDVLADRASDLVGASAALASRVLSARAMLRRAAGAVATAPPGLLRIRVHGDYQLDQVLLAHGRFVLIDFEGEPLRPIAERRGRFLAMKDVAGMVRSYSYAAYTALFEVAGDDERLAERLDPVARWWQAEAAAAFVAGYRGATHQTGFVPNEDAEFATLLSAFVVEKAAYELRYEIGHRPRWLRIPLRGMVDTVDALGTRS